MTTIRARSIGATGADRGSLELVRDRLAPGAAGTDIAETSLARDEPLDATDTVLLKGIGILLIAMHNFLHLVNSIPGENQFGFEPQRFGNLLHAFVDQPQGAVRLLFSYFGHYGVQIFMFMSAYGLTRRFTDAVPAYGDFMRRRLQRVYPTFVLALGLWLTWRTVMRGRSLEETLHLGYPIFLKLTLVSNFVPGQALFPVGPWWFLSFIVQFYLVFPVLFRASERWGTRFLVLVSTISVVAVVGLQAIGLTSEFLFATILGHMPSFCLGIFFARQGSFKIPRWMLAGAAPLFLLGNVSRPFWYFSHVCALILILGLWEQLRGTVRSTRWTFLAIAFLGGISMELFYVNGFLREPFLTWAAQRGSELWTFAYMLLALAVSVGGALLLVRLRHLVWALWGRAMPAAS